MAYVEANDQRIFFTDTGGEGPAVLFSHGFFMDHEMWSPQVALLEDGFRCITWDARGWGQTETATETFDYWDLVEDGCAILDHLEVDEAVWCGMSQGGFVSLRAALHCPARVRGLVLIDTSPHPESPETKALYDAMFEQARAQGLDAGLASAIAGLLFAPDYDASVWRAKMTARPPASRARAMECMTGRDDISSRLGEIVAPALVVHGELDAVFPVDGAESWAADLSSLTEFIRIPAAGHTANLENPTATNDALLRFLTALPPLTRWASRRVRSPARPGVGGSRDR